MYFSGSVLYTPGLSYLSDTPWTPFRPTSTSSISHPLECPMPVTTDPLACSSRTCCLPATWPQASTPSTAFNAGVDILGVTRHRVLSSHAFREYITAPVVACSPVTAALAVPVQQALSAQLHTLQCHILAPCSPSTGPPSCTSGFWVQVAGPEGYSQA